MSPRIAVFTKNWVNPGYEAARIGADRTAVRLGASTIHYVPEQPDNVEEQINLIRRAIDEKPDAVLFVPVHETAVNDAILAFDAAHIPMFNFASRTTVGKRICFVGSDDRALALNIARYLFTKLSGRGEIVIVEGALASPTSRDRLAGFYDALAQFPEVKVRMSLRGEYQRTIARSAFADAADQLRGIDAVLCANDSMALGVLDALTSETSSKTLPLVAGVNAIPEAIAAIEAKQMLATANFDPMAMSAVSMEAAVRYLTGEAIPPEIILPVQIVDATNCSEWNLPFADRACPIWQDVIGDAGARVDVEALISPR
jgi:ribose transport system substrate-binding protein